MLLFCVRHNAFMRLTIPIRTIRSQKDVFERLHEQSTGSRSLQSRWLYQ